MGSGVYCEVYNTVMQCERCGLVCDGKKGEVYNVKFDKKVHDLKFGWMLFLSFFAQLFVWLIILRGHADNRITRQIAQAFSMLDCLKSCVVN